MDGISVTELEACLYSRTTLSSLSLVLPSETYSEWISEMTKSGLDYKNPVGVDAYKVFKNLCIVERNKSEASRGAEKSYSPKIKPKSPRSQGSPKPKQKSTHQVLEEREESNTQNVFAISYHNTKWFLPSLKFPCPIGIHKHELSTCLEFFSFSPAERWNKMDEGKFCYAYLLPKDVCVTKRCKFEAKVPETLKCQGCAPWSRSKDLAPFSILFCRNKNMHS